MTSGPVSVSTNYNGKEVRQSGLQEFSDTGNNWTPEHFAKSMGYDNVADMKGQLNLDDAEFKTFYQTFTELPPNEQSNLKSLLGPGQARNLRIVSNLSPEQTQKLLALEPTEMKAVLDHYYPENSSEEPPAGLEKLLKKPLADIKAAIKDKDWPSND
jgi:hypothetical protein